MPEMGESVTEGIVLEWHVAEGDFVNEGDTVVEVSTDKVDAEVPAPTAGTITRLIAAGRRRGSGRRAAGGDGPRPKRRSGRGSTERLKRTPRGAGGHAGRSPKPPFPAPPDRETRGTAKEGATAAPTEPPRCEGDAARPSRRRCHGR